MAERGPLVLILDDGELEDLALLLAELRVDYRRVRGADASPQLPTPRHLLATTPRRAADAPQGDGPDRPLRVIAADEDSNALRAMLRRLGFDLLVRRPTHREVWRLLVQRALYQGEERRSERRVPLASEVRVDAGPDASGALLVDLSNRGCRLSLSGAVERGARIALRLPVPDGEPLRLAGRVVRVLGRDVRRLHVGVLFDSDLPESDRERLGALLNAWSCGDPPGAARDDLPPLPACASPSIPGLTWDDETDPAVAAPADVQLDCELQPADRPDRRRQRRGRYDQPVVARQEAGPSVVLMGRDLSAEGMRVEAGSGLEPGERLELAVYGPERPEPYRVRATVVRDDGPQGMALRFDAPPPGVATALEKLVACLPDVESLRDGEASGLGSVVTEVLGRLRADAEDDAS